jgi:hypothetical protein
MDQGTFPNAGAGESSLLSSRDLTPVFHLTWAAQDFTTIYMFLVPPAKPAHGLSAFAFSADTCLRIHVSESFCRPGSGDIPEHWRTRMISR